MKRARSSSNLRVAVSRTRARQSEPSSSCFILSLPFEMIATIVGSKWNAFEEFAALYLTCRQLYALVPELKQRQLVHHTIRHLKLQTRIVGIYDMLAFVRAPLLDQWANVEQLLPHSTHDEFWSLDVPSDEGFKPLLLLNELIKRQNSKSIWTEHPMAMRHYAGSSQAPVSASIEMTSKRQRMLGMVVRICNMVAPPATPSMKSVVLDNPPLFV